MADTTTTDQPTGEAAMQAALRQRLTQLRVAEIQAAYQLGRAAGAVAEVEAMLSGFDAPYPPAADGVGIDGGGPASGAAGSPSPFVADVEPPLIP